MKGTCRFCGCTDARACAGGCSWADLGRTICSQCAPVQRMAIAALPLLANLAHHVKPSLEVEWADLTQEHQQLLVVALRALVTEMLETTQRCLTEEAEEALEDLRELGLHIIEKFPEERAKVVESGESIVDVAIRLLNSATPAPSVLITG